MALEARFRAIGLLGAEKYADAFEAEEWDWDGLVTCSEDVLDQIIKKVGMKEGSEHKLRQCLAAERETKMGGSGMSVMSAPGIEDSMSPGSVRVSGAAARESDGGRAFAEGCRWLYGYGEGIKHHAGSNDTEAFLSRLSRVEVFRLVLETPPVFSRPGRL